ncbi:MAG: hypothetical protein AAGG68_10790 [Bacteroidota bacterium]
MKLAKIFVLSSELDDQKMAKNRQMDNKSNSIKDSKKMKMLSEQKALLQQLLKLEEKKLKAMNRG